MCVWLDEELADPTVYYKISKLTQKKLQSKKINMHELKTQPDSNIFFLANPTLFILTLYIFPPAISRIGFANFPYKMT